MTFIKLDQAFYKPDFDRVINGLTARLQDPDWVQDNVETEKKVDQLSTEILQYCKINRSFMSLDISTDLIDAMQFASQGRDIARITDRIGTMGLQADKSRRQYCNKTKEKLHEQLQGLDPETAIFHLMKHGVKIKSKEIRRINRSLLGRTNS